MIYVISNKWTWSNLNLPNAVVRKPKIETNCDFVTEAACRNIPEMVISHSYTLFLRLYALMPDLEKVKLIVAKKFEPTWSKVPKKQTRKMSLRICNVPSYWKYILYASRCQFLTEKVLPTNFPYSIVIHQGDERSQTKICAANVIQKEAYEDWQNKKITCAGQCCSHR